MAALRAQEGIAARALEFTILTAARTGEVTGAKRHEFDAELAIWTIPAVRTKVARPHCVPLSSAAAKIVREMLKVDTGDLVFPGGKGGKPLSSGAMLAVLARMGHGDLAVHGMRSTLRDWAAECTSFPNHVVEMALAHVVEDKVEGAYRRGDLFEKRRRLMEAWAGYCGTERKGGTVVPIRAAGE